jgi:glycosyltransferase involved in cell wall biosynthesis
MKTISFIVPCYNSAAYMDTCITSVLACDDGSHDIEIIIVDDGSTADDTLAKAQEWQAKHPEVIRAIHQENAGHGGAVNTGLANAQGLYFKVVDSDDWLDDAAMHDVMDYLRVQRSRKKPTDLVVANYVYDKVLEGTRKSIGYHHVFPVGTEFTWDETGHFKQSQNLLMHAVIYRTEVLRESGIHLPEHTFYVDNIFVYVPLPYVKTLYYLDVDMYHYFIGREDQSVNEEVMYSRRDQQLRITRVMIDAVDLNDVESPKLRRYMQDYLSMMMCICSVFMRLHREGDNELQLKEIWNYLRIKRPESYPYIRSRFINWGMNIPTNAGRLAGLSVYRLAQRIFKFN